jgi:hypothetical protein
MKMRWKMKFFFKSQLLQYLIGGDLLLKHEGGQQHYLLVELILELQESKTILDSEP